MVGIKKPKKMGDPHEELTVEKPIQTGLNLHGGLHLFTGATL